jgi:plasmid maintenance system antidote protein VapI
MSQVLSAKSLKEIERGIGAGKCLTLIPRKNGSVHVVDNSEFLTPEETEAFMKTLPRPTPGDVLERFIWEFADGSVKKFAAKAGYHPNRISVLKASTKGLSMRLVRRIVKAYKLSEQEQAFWVKRFLNV